MVISKPDKMSEGSPYTYIPLFEWNPRLLVSTLPSDTAEPLSRERTWYCSYVDLGGKNTKVLWCPESSDVDCVSREQQSAIGAFYVKPFEKVERYEFEYLFGFGGHCEGYTKDRVIRVARK
jgi:hypothetical protein